MNLWMLPAARNSYFTGRDFILQKICDELSLRGRVALSGLGGVGKTQIAVEYTYRYRDDYLHVFWLNAGDASMLAASFARVAEYLDLPERDAEDRSAAVDAVLRWMESQDRWLAIYDNADELSALEGFWPRTFTGHILVTSRAQVFDVFGIPKPLEVAEMLPEEALTFLLRRTGREDSHQEEERSAAATLSSELGYLPLALEQAGAYIAGKQARFSAYLQSFRKHRLTLLERAKPAFANMAASVSTTWTIAFESLQAAPAAADVLHLSSVLNADGIPLELLQRGAEELGPQIARALCDSDDELRVDELLEPLTRYSLIRRDIASRTYSVHRLVQDVIIARIAEAERRLWSERAVRAMAVAFPEEEYGDWPLCERLATNVNVALKMVEDGEVSESLEAAKLFSSAGRYLIRRGQYGQAAPLFSRALSIREKLHGKDHPDVAASLNNMANVYFGQGLYAQSQALHEQALAMRERLLGPSHPDVAMSLNNVANVYYVRGNYAQAEPLYKRSLAIKEANLGPSHSDLALGLDNLGTLYHDQGNYAEAERLHRRALEMREELFGSDHPFVAASLDNLANVYRSQAKYAQAEPWHRRALEIHEKMLGPDHHHAAESMVNLANVYRHQGKFADAEPLCRRALSIYENALGAEHPDVARCVNELACLLRAQGRRDEAQQLHERAVSIIEKVLGSDHPVVVEIREDFARSTPRRTRSGDVLTAREREVANLVAAGRSNRSIAGSLSLSERTVETHVASILGKLNMSSRSEIVAYVVAEKVQ